MNRGDPAALRELLRALFDAALAAADPARLITEEAIAALLPEPAAGRTVVVGAGKASAAMAGALEKACEKAWPGPPGKRLEGLVVTRRGHAARCSQIAVVEASHPVPDQAGQQAARRILDLAQGLGPADQLICLVSGGGSALLTLPAPGLSLADKQAVTRALLRCGATIGEINAVRKHLSAIKGGRLAAAAAPAPILTLAISDVPGDDPAVIASGPTVADPTDLRRRARRARQVPHRTAASGVGAPRRRGGGNAQARRSAVPPDAVCADCQPAAGARRRRRGRPRPPRHADRAERPHRGRGARCRRRCMPRSRCSCAVGNCASATASSRRPRCCCRAARPPSPCAAAGRGGRNVEFLLGLAAALGKDPAGAPDAQGIAALACDTDGIDGTEDNAGAIVYPDTLARAAVRGIALDKALAENDGYGFFAALGDLVVTGPTLTNVNDFRAILILPNASRG